MVDLTAIFGNEIKVVYHPAAVDRQLCGFAGAHGLTVMHMGSRGRLLVIGGRIRATGESYIIARAALEALITTLQAFSFCDAGDYTYKNSTYMNVIFDQPKLSPKSGRYGYNSQGYCWVDFTCQGLQLA